jgi:hypothetical protein
MGEKRNAYRILVGNPEGKRPLGRLRRRWVDNIKMDLREIGWDGRDWIDLVQDRNQWRALVNAVMNLRVSSYLSKIHFNIVHPPTSWSSQWPLPFWISNQYPICIPLLPHS